MRKKACETDCCKSIKMVYALWSEETYYHEDIFREAAALKMKMMQ